MDYSESKVKRAKKSDKAKESYEKNGGFTQKHIRVSMAAAEARLNSKKK